MKQGLAVRRSAVKILGRVFRQQQMLDEAFRAEAKDLTPQDAGFLKALVTTVLRRRGQIDAALAPFLPRKPEKIKPPQLLDILRLGAAQILCMDGTAAHAAVDLAVEAAAKNRKTSAAKNMVNAVLRRMLRENVVLPPDASLNIPPWLFKIWEADYGRETALRIADTALREPVLDITVKNMQERQKWAESLGGIVLPTGSLRCADAGGRIGDMSGFAEGAWWVQDAAAALPVQILAQGADLRGRHVVDLCAAPGGKTLQLAAMGASVTAVDKSAARLSLLEENLKRTGLEKKVTLVEADVTQWQPETPSDFVLLDAPCSATGTLRRHPDLLYLKREGDIAALAALQRAARQNAAQMLNAGGRLVYAVCSLQKAEGEAHPPPENLLPEPVKDFVFEAESDGNIRSFPFSDPGAAGGMDGFFIARFRRN